MSTAKMYSVIIIEDEAPAAQLIELYLKNIPHINVICHCKDGFEGVKAIQEHKPDIIFLDVQMPKLNGFEMLELVEEKPYVIFTTAFDEYAIKAFEMNAVDYLLKPFSKERFLNAIEKASILLETTQQRNYKEVNPKFSSSYLERIAIKEHNNIKILSTHDMSHIEAYGDYVLVHENGQSYIKQKTMAYYESALNPLQFVRVHRSFIVNVDFIEKINLWEKDTYKVNLKTGIEIRASRSGYKKLKQIWL